MEQKSMVGMHGWSCPLVGRAGAVGGPLAGAGMTAREEEEEGADPDLTLPEAADPVAAPPTAVDVAAAALEAEAEH